MAPPEIDSYRIFYWSNTSTGYPDAQIDLKDKSGKSVGVIEFYHIVPANCNKLIGKFIHLCYHMSRFNDIINILRYEKPLYIFINTQNLAGGIWTSETTYEPAGEEES
jgi:hypothetical protein